MAYGSWQKVSPWRLSSRWLRNFAAAKMSTVLRSVFCVAIRSACDQRVVEQSALL
jgi:hypothetical protein